MNRIPTNKYNRERVVQIISKHITCIPNDKVEDAKEHAAMVVDRYLTACNDLPCETEPLPQIVVEAVEDYIIKMKHGVSVIDYKSSEDMHITRLLQYVSPNRKYMS